MELAGYTFSIYHDYNYHDYKIKNNIRYGCRKIFMFDGACSKDKLSDTPNQYFIKDNESIRISQYIENKTGIKSYRAFFNALLKMENKTGIKYLDSYTKLQFA